MTVREFIDRTDANGHPWEQVYETLKKRVDEIRDDSQQVISSCHCQSCILFRFGGVEVPERAFENVTVTFNNTPPSETFIRLTDYFGNPLDRANDYWYYPTTRERGGSTWMTLTSPTV